MAEFEHPSGRQRPEQTIGCMCGRHRSQLEHQHEAHRLLQCVPVTNGPGRYDGLLAGQVMRAHFSKG